MTATINTFPPLNAFTSPRGWALAAIVLLHLGFFWALTNGLSLKIPTVFPPPMVTEFIQTKPTLPPDRPVDEPTEFDQWQILAPEPEATFARDDNSTTVTAQPMPEQIVRTDPVVDGPGQGPALTVVEPELDYRYFSQPMYPAAAIRSGVEGTVLLSVRVGANGRALEVRLDRSSGHTLLDQSALREARRWRFVAGTQGGQATTMWTQIPVKFRLQ